MTNKPGCEKNNNVKKITVIYIQSKEERASVGLHFAGNTYVAIHFHYTGISLA